MSDDWNTPPPKPLSAWGMTPREPRWKFDPTVNLGHVLTFAGFMMTIIKGHARYTANFAPPSAPFPTS